MDRLTHLVVSDLHLGSDTPDRQASFLRLVAGLPHLHTLYVLGDWFDAWVGDDAAPPFSLELKAALENQNLAHLRFTPGNRDFLLASDFFPGEIAESFDAQLGGRLWHFTHGDQYCTDDAAYMAWRSQCRNHDWQAQFLAQPIDVRQTFAAKAREASQASGRSQTSAIADVCPASLPPQPVIHGHTHRPAVHRGIQNRVVLGDWTHAAWVVVGNTENAWLAYWNGEGLTQSIAI